CDGSADVCSSVLLLCVFVCYSMVKDPPFRSSSACDRQTHREDSAQLASSEFSLLYYIFKYKSINTCINTFFFFFTFFLNCFCVCLLVSSVSRSHAYAVPVPATDRQIDTPRGQCPASLQ